MTQPKRMHLSSYYPSCLFFFIFFFCFFPVGLFYSFVVVTAESASPQKNKTKKLFRMAQKWWMRCKNEQDMHHERQSNAHYCITTKTLFELQGHTKINKYIFIISLEMTVLHVTVGLLRPRVLTWWVTSAMPNAKAHWTLFLFVFLAAMTEQQEKRSRMKRNKKKRGIKKIGVGDVRGQNWNPGQPSLVVASSFRKFVV